MPSTRLVDPVMEIADLPYTFQATTKRVAA